MATKEELMQKLRNADAAGDEYAAKRFAEMIRAMEPSQADLDAGADVPVLSDEPTAEAQPTLSGAADVIATGALGAGKSALEGLSMLGGVTTQPGKVMGAVDESVEAARAMGIPQPTLGAEGEAVINLLSEKYKDLAPQVVQDVISAYGSLGEDVGDYVLDKTGSPLLATGARMIPDAIESIATLGGARVARQAAQSAADAPIVGGKDIALQSSDPITAASEVASGAVTGGIGKLQDLSGKQRELKQQIRAGDIDRYASRYDVTPYGVLAKNPTVKKAESLGVDTGLISMIRRAKNLPSDVTVKKMRQMLNIKRQGRKYIEQESRNQPSVVAGNSLLDRLDKVKQVNKQAGKAIKPIAQSLKGQDVDFEPSINAFINNLDEFGASYNPNTKSLSFSEKSLIGRNPAAKKLINEIVDYMSVGGKPDAYDLHELKIFLDDQLSYGKAAQTGISGKSEGIIRQLRADIDAALDGRFPEYDEVNSIYSETIEVLDEIQSLAGKRFDLSGKRNKNMAGKLMRGLMQMNKGTEPLINAIDDIETLARKYGGNYDDNLAMLNRFAVELDSKFGSSAPAGFQGGIEAGVDIGMQRGKARAAYEAGAKAVKKGKEALLGDDVQDERLKFDVLEELLGGMQE